MVLLKNIQVDNDFASAVCYPDGNENEKFELTVSISRESIVCQSHGVSDAYLFYAKKLLLKSAQKEQIPEEIYTMWH